MSASAVLFTDAFYPIFKFMLQIPCTAITNFLGNRKAVILGNIFVALSIFLLLPASGVTEVIISQFFSAFGYALKGLTESNLLYDSILRSPKRNDLFSTIDGRSSSFFYYIDAITSVLAGFLFVVNGYLPMIFCFVLCVISIFLSFRFKEVHVPSANLKKETLTLKNNVKDLRQTFVFIFQSSRLRHLLLFNGMLCALFALLPTLRSSLLTDISFPEQYYGIVYAILAIVSGIASARSNWFHNQYRNRTLTVLGIVSSVCLLCMGLPIILGVPYGFGLCLLCLLFILLAAMRGPFYTLIKRYLNSFSTSSMRPKILAISDLGYSIFRSLFSFIGSWLLGFTSTSYVCLILGCLFLLLFTLLLDRMRHTVGLKPEEYPQKDITFVPLH